MHILIIEDSETDYRFIERALNDQFTLSREVTLAAGLEWSSRQPLDLVILDLSLDDSRGYPTFESARAAFPKVPILVLSGLEDDELALRAVRNGAQDFVQKARLLDSPLDRIAQYAIERWRFEKAARHAERQFRVLFDHLPTAAYACDSQGLITYFNVVAAELWGRSPKLNDPSDRYCGSFRMFSADGTPMPHDQCWMARSLQERVGFNGREKQIERPDGTRSIVEAHANPILDGSGTLIGAINVLVDVTSQRLAERAIYESERFARATVNSLAAHIAILDETGTIIAVNAAWDRFGSQNCLPTPRSDVKMNYLDVCDAVIGEEAATAAATAAGIRSVLRREQSYFELDYPCHSPTEERWFTMRATIFDGDGPTRVVISHENVTQQKIAERLAREQAGLRDAVEGMEQVLGVVGHELRTPLAALRAISEFLLSDGARDTAEADRFLREISEEVDRMSDTVNNLLEAARINSGRAKWNWSELDLREVADDAVASIYPLIDLARVNISSSVDPSATHMLGDADAMRRLLINLLSNARKHTRAGQIEVVVSGFTDVHGAWTVLSVRDTGCGIPPHVAARLGEAFALNSGVVGSNWVSGTGLGLAICKGIVAAHGGEMAIQSVEGRGTTVTVRVRADLPSAVCGDTVRESAMKEMAA